MGLDIVEILMQIEDRFEIKSLDSVLDSIAESGPDLTAGELHFLVGVKLRELGRPVPRSCWNGIRLAIGETLNISPLTIRPHTRLLADLGAQ